MSSHDLHVTEMGERGPRVAFFHGLFGQGRNWTQIAKSLSGDFRVQLVDMPNHGRSAWTEQLSYVDLADRVAPLFAAEDPVRLIGHSMGGKIAMTLALRRPELVERLVAVDISPVAYAHVSEFAGYIEAMQALDLDRLRERGDADAGLAEAVPNRTVRSFLLQNLRREGAGHKSRWRWQANLELLGADLDSLGGWPAEALADTTPYAGRVLWIAGQTSDYVTSDYAAEMKRWFPNTQKVTVKNAGHWVHSEQPEIFLALLKRFLDQR